MADNNPPLIIVTRPPGQASSLLDEIEGALGDKVKLAHLPLIRVQPLEFHPPDAADIDCAIFVSRNAASFFFDRAESGSWQLFALGSHSAEHIFELSGKTATYPQQMNSEGLLQLPELNSVKDQKWLIIKGEGGRTLINTTLHERGARVTELDVYRRCLPELTTQKAIETAATEQPIWVVTSGEALSHLHRILGLSQNPTHQTRLIVSSDRLAEQAKKLGFKIFAQSAGASQSQLVQCVKQCFSDQG